MEEKKEMSEEVVVGLAKKIINVNKLFTMALKTMPMRNQADTDAFMKVFIDSISEESPQDLAYALHTLAFMIKAISVCDCKDAFAPFLAKVLIDGMNESVEHLCKECPLQNKCDHKNNPIEEQLFMAMEHPVFEEGEMRSAVERVLADHKGDPRLKAEDFDNFLKGLEKNMNN